LSSSLGFFALAIDILVVIEVKGTKLNSSTINLSVAGHADSLFLLKNSSLEAGSARGNSLGSRLQSRGSIAARSGLLSLVLLLGG
jgi:hypothetical protein